jgi:hypothetical protein
MAFTFTGEVASSSCCGVTESRITIEWLSSSAMPGVMGG